VAAAARPLVANNIFAIQSGGCGNGRFDSNLVVSGKPCPADNQGPANLDALAHPTSVSSLVISQADPLVAPATDALGKSRIGKPDRGAYESPF
jgi:hypothetical protein